MTTSESNVSFINSTPTSIAVLTMVSYFFSYDSLFRSSPVLFLSSCLIFSSSAFFASVKSASFFSSVPKHSFIMRGAKSYISSSSKKKLSRYLFAVAIISSVKKFSKRDCLNVISSFLFFSPNCIAGTLNSLFR